MYSDLKKVLDEEGLECWAASGTLLGWVHRGFIPWNDNPGALCQAMFLGWDSWSAVLSGW